MPAPGATLAQDTQRTTSGRWKMLLLALVCAAPVVASYISYYVVRPGGGTSLGQLIDPQRPLRESLGKDKDRLDWLWLVTDAERVPDALRPALAQATVVRVPEAELAKWLTPQAGQTLADSTYVVDPAGHWMMRFPGLTKDNASKAKRDLQRLLRASASWDQAGRE